MKTFYVALITFALLLALIALNTVFIHRTVRELEAALDALPPCEQAGVAVEALGMLWERKKPLVGLSVSRDIMREMDDRLASLSAAAHTGDEDGFDAATRLIRTQLAHVRDAECFSIDNLL